jgi:NAD+ kinase
MLQVHKFFVVGKWRHKLLPKLELCDLCMVDKAEDADVIVCYGGDGTLLDAVSQYQDAWYWPIRDEQTAPLCEAHQLDKQFQLLRTNNLKRGWMRKLIGKAKIGPIIEGPAIEPKLYGMNDIFLHSANQATALRYTVEIDGQLYAREVVSDAVGVATQHGATAYYRNITHSIFRVGIGLAFSNSTETVDHIVLDENSTVTIKLLRGPAVMTADNQTCPEVINAGDTVKISLSDKWVGTLGLDVFMCPECRKLRHSLRDSTRFLGGAK